LKKKFSRRLSNSIAKMTISGVVGTLRDDCST
jgi:hypothetical protein